MKGAPAAPVGMVLTSILVMILASTVAANARVPELSESNSRGSADFDNQADSASSDVGIRLADPVVGSFKLNPEVLNLRSSGKYVTGMLTLPEGRSVRDVYIPSVRLNGIVYASTSFGPHNLVVKYENKESLMLKFDREWVQEVLSPGTAVSVWVTGLFTDGISFIAKGEAIVNA